MTFSLTAIWTAESIARKLCVICCTTFLRTIFLEPARIHPTPAARGPNPSHPLWTSRPESKRNAAISFVISVGEDGFNGDALPIRCENGAANLRSFCTVKNRIGHVIARRTFRKWQIWNNRFDGVACQCAGLRTQYVHCGAVAVLDMPLDIQGQRVPMVLA